MHELPDLYAMIEFSQGFELHGAFSLISVFRVATLLVKTCSIGPNSQDERRTITSYASELIFSVYVIGTIRIGWEIPLKMDLFLRTIESGLGVHC